MVHYPQRISQPAFEPVQDTSETRTPEWGAWCRFVVALVGVRLVWLAFDSTPMLFLGDSEAYLGTALEGWIPPDRSFAYGYLVRWLCVPAGSLLPLLLAQAVASCVAGVVLASLLLRCFLVPRWWAFSTALLWAGLEPFALLYERYLMTEAFALAALACMAWCTVRYLAAPAVRWILLVNCFGLGVLALRYSFVPVAWLTAFALPFLAGIGWRRCLVHVAISLLATAALHEGYQRIYGRLARRPPAYQYADGLFLVAAWSPVLVPADFGDEALGREVLLGRAADANRLSEREADRWSEDGLVARLARLAGGDMAANAVARRASWAAFWRDPLGVVALCCAACLEWFSPEQLRLALHYDRGERPIPERTLGMLRARFGLDADRLHLLATPTNRWFLASRSWAWLLLTAPLWLLALVPAIPRSARRPAAWLAFLVVCLVVLPFVAATKPVPRYLHPVAWLVILLAGGAGGWLAGTMRGNRAENQESEGLPQTPTSAQLSSREESR